MLSRFLPDRLSQWMAALVVGGILLTQALALSLYHADRVHALETAETRQAARCLAGFARVLGPESPDHRAMMMRRLMFHHFGPPDDRHPPPDFGPGPHGPALDEAPLAPREPPLTAGVPPAPPVRGVLV